MNKVFHVFKKLELCVFLSFVLSLSGVWMGEPKTLDLSVLSKELPVIPLQHPELELGYSKPAN